MKALKIIILKTSLLLVMINLQSCLSLILTKQHAKPKLEHDEVKGITRFKSTLFYNRAEERFSSFLNSEQQIFKEMDGVKTTYNLYDYLKLENTLTQIEDTIYFLIDKKIYPVEINSQSNERLSDINKDEEDVMLADSSKMTVIEDYEIRHYSLVSVNYRIDESLVSKIAHAGEVKIRYYAQPEMITLRLSNLKKKTFKKLLQP